DSLVGCRPRHPSHTMYEWRDHVHLWHRVGELRRSRAAPTTNGWAAARSRDREGCTEQARLSLGAQAVRLTRERPTTLIVVASRDEIARLLRESSSDAP